MVFLAVVIGVKLLGLEQSFRTYHHSRWGSVSSDNTTTPLHPSSRTRPPAAAGELPKVRYHSTSQYKGDSEYSRVVVIPRTRNEDTRWIKQELPDVDFSIYVADDALAPHHPPKNKGHEVMIYLSFIIENYDRLPDVVLFMHAHRWTHHNNELLDFDAAQMIRRLSSAHVVREGYVNLRCHWDPGCPDWLHANSTAESMGKQEEAVLAQCWRELFPADPMPAALSQPCCAQFAVARHRIRQIPRARFTYYRDWILRTPLSDYISGRIWEYSWQYLFTGQPDSCPPEHACYCDAFGLCFGGSAAYQSFQDTQRLHHDYQADLQLLRAQATSSLLPSTAAALATRTLLPFTGDHQARLAYLEEQIAALEKELLARKQHALARGADPRKRAEECGRTWREGDGF